MARKTLAETGPGFGTAGCVLGVAMLATLWPLISGRAEPIWDARDMGYAAFVYSADALAEGRLPLWDPYTNCGYPFGSDPGVPNPVALLFGLISGGSPFGFVAFWIFFWLLAAAGVVVWARSHDASPAGAVLAAVSFAFCGYFVGNAEHTGFVVFGGCLPWIFWTGEQAVARRSIGYALLCGAWLGTSGAYPPMTAFGGVALAMWLTARALSRDLHTPPLPDEKGSPRFRTLVWVALTLAMAAGISLAIGLPFVMAFLTEGRGYADRTSALSYEVANFNNVFSLPALYSLLFPYSTIVAHPVLQTDISMANGYVGVLAFPLALIWLADEWRRGRRVWWLVGFVVFFFLAAMGGRAGVRLVLYYLLPPARFMRHSAVLRVFWSLPLALGAGLGLYALERSAEARRHAWRFFAAWGTVAVGAAVSLSSSLHGHGLTGSSLRIYGVTAGVLACATVVTYAARTARAAGGRMLSSLVAAIVIVEMCAHVYSNHSTVWHSPAGSVPQVAAQHRRATTIRGEPGGRLPPLAFGSFNVQQIVKKPVVLGYTTMNTKEFDNVLARSRFAGVLQMPTRAWLSPGVEVAASRTEALDALTKTGPDDPIPVFVGDVRAVQTAPRVRAGAFGKVTTVLYSPERVEMRVAVPGAAPAFLATTERFAAGWRAWIDGAPAPIVPTNLFFRGISVPPGTHHVEWRYEPGMLPVLGPLAQVVLLGSFAAGLALVRSDRRRASATRDQRLAASAPG